MEHDNWLKIDIFERISQSAFRSRFKLTAADIEYIQNRGIETIRSHAEDFVRKRLAPAVPKNDGKQTPMRGAPKGHPVFLAQHATATCCRSCMEMWHGIEQRKELSEQERKYVVDVIIAWIDREMRFRVSREE